MRLRMKKRRKEVMIHLYEYGTNGIDYIQIIQESNRKIKRGEKHEAL